jgi:release factor glutamine methyltransferase
VAAPVASSSAEAPWTVGRILDWTAQHLKKHGSESPRLEAEILLAHARKCPRIQLYVQYNEPLSDDERLVMRELVKRRAAAEPVAYLVGHREFFGLDFRVSPAVLIPRPETETLVLELVTAAKRR